MNLLKKKKSNGFSLIEVMIAILVFSVGLLGVAQIMIIVINSNVFARNLTTATALAQDRLENIYRLGYVNANTSTGTEEYGSIPNFTPYKRVTSVFFDSPDVGMKTATITVSWSGNKHSVTLSTIFVE